MTKEKSYKPHIKVYPRDENEEKIMREFADKKGYSASAWLRVLALREIQKEGE